MESRLTGLVSMAHVDNFAEFSRLLVASGLLAENSLDSLLHDFREHVSRGPTYGNSLTAFGDYLVGSNILTCWQYNKLRNGQWNGFFLDQYKLLDQMGATKESSLYLARDTTTGACVVLSITPTSIVPLKDGKPRYNVEPFNPQNPHAAPFSLGDDR